MSQSLLLQPPTNASPQTTLKLSQHGPSYYKSQTSWFSSLPYPLSLFLNTESQEKWQIYENIFLACLRSGDNESAYLYLEELTDRFGQTNERVTGLRGLYAEATAKTQAELDDVLKHYEEMVREEPTCFAIRKRRAALLRSMGRSADAVTALTSILNQSPTDAEAWSELADLYLTQGAYDQAVFSLEEVLLIMPNAWNMHAKIGEVIFLQAKNKEAGPEQLKVLTESMRRFCRSIELCDDYLRGYYGLKLATNRLLDILPLVKKSQQVASDPVTGDLAPPSIESIKKLNALATAKLAEIVRRGTAGEKDWDGYSEAELIAARALLDRDTQHIQR